MRAPDFFEKARKEGRMIRLMWLGMKFVFIALLITFLLPHPKIPLTDATVDALQEFLTNFWHVVATLVAVLAAGFSISLLLDR